MFRHLDLDDLRHLAEGRPPHTLPRPMDSEPEQAVTIQRLARALLEAKGVEPPRLPLGDGRAGDPDDPNLCAQPHRLGRDCGTPWCPWWRGRDWAEDKHGGHGEV